ncbi:MAG TPA: hypothetical protein VFP97_09350 [Chitinophagaceae bacterium]|nr:hypothetical protein [Chitinophagaceae bacterium]
MKQATQLILFLASVSLVSANPVEDRYSRVQPGDSSLLKMTSMQEMLQQIVNVIGVKENFELKEANVLNIEATLSDKKRYIVYNPDFITTVNTVTKNKWSVMWLLAHEIGHHVNGHTSGRTGSNLEFELEADEFAGYILHKLGATLGESQNVMFFIARAEASKTHPGRSSRLLAIEKGWIKAGTSEEKTTTTN